MAILAKLFFNDNFSCLAISSQEQTGVVVKFKALSIVHPGGQKISQGLKTIEVRSWRPPADFAGDLLIIENHKYLRAEGETDPEGKPVAIVKIKSVREYLESDISAAAASRWEPGYYSWELTDVRPIESTQKVLAARDIYDVEIESLAMIELIRS